MKADIITKTNIISKFDKSTALGMTSTGLIITSILCMSIAVFRNSPLYAIIILGSIGIVGGFLSNYSSKLRKQAVDMLFNYKES